MLLDQQNSETNGFHTHFRADKPRLADPNVEATAVALLALHTLQQGPPQPIKLGLPAANGQVLGATGDREPVPVVADSEQTKRGQHHAGGDLWLVHLNCLICRLMFPYHKRSDLKM